MPNALASRSDGRGRASEPGQMRGRYGHRVSRRGRGSAGQEGGRRFGSARSADPGVWGANGRMRTKFSRVQLVGELLGDTVEGGEGNFPTGSHQGGGSSRTRRTVWRAPIGLSDRAAAPSTTKVVSSHECYTFPARKGNEGPQEGPENALTGVNICYLWKGRAGERTPRHPG